MGLAMREASVETKMGDVPDGPDPLELVQGDMRRLKRKIKAVIDRNLGSGGETHPLLKSSSKDFFERSEKTWRPTVVLLLGQALSQSLPVEERAAYMDDCMVLAEIVEIMHTSTVIHDTVLEDFDSLEKGNPAHVIYSSSVAGNKISILSGDFLLARASVLLSSLRNTQVVEIMAGALEAIMTGQMGLHRPSGGLTTDNYIRTVEDRTSKLLASGCLCAALVAGHKADSEVAMDAERVGMKLGTAYQITRDMIMTEKNYEKLWKKINGCVDRGDEVVFDQYEINEPLQRASCLIYVLEHDAEMRNRVESEGGFKDVEQLLSAREAIESTNAVGVMRGMAEDSATDGIRALKSVPEGDAREALSMLAHYVVQPSQDRLQRVNYKEGGYVAPKEDKDSKSRMWGTQLAKAKKGARFGLFSTISAKVGEKITAAGLKNRLGSLGGGKAKRKADE